MNVLQTLEEELKWVTLHHVSSGTGTLAQLPHEGLVNYSLLLLKSAFFFPSKWVINHQKKIAKGPGWGVVPLLCPYTEDKAISHEAISLLPRSYVQVVVSPGDLKALCER